MGDWKPVTIATFDDPVVADLAKSRLEAEGLRAQVLDQHVNAMYGGAMQTALGGIRLQVDESDSSQAKEILAAVDPDYKAGDSCPQCGKETYRLAPRRRTMRALFTFFFAGRAVVKTSGWRCSSCGYASA